ncbi:MAG: tetratricopeptide repeat protein [Xanthobacteraceae bacterium]|nr:tetratricopeptide repeat protein [Xanthobacteraceae bacterium]
MTPAPAAPALAAAPPAGPAEPLPERATPPAAVAGTPVEQPAAPAGAAPSETPPAAVPPAAAPQGAGAAPAPARRASNGQVVVDMRRQGDALRITFPFAQPTPSAAFRRGDTLWLVFDSAEPIDVTDMVAKSARVIRTATVSRSRGGQVVHLRLDRPQLTSVETEGNNWTVILGDMMLEPTRPLGIVRAFGAGGRMSATIAFDEPKQLHRISDPEIGDVIMAVTALGPARGFVKTQDFVEFRALASTHGVAIQPLADDLNAEIGSDKILLTRPGGLTMSDTRSQANGTAKQDPLASAARDANYRPFVFDTQLWGFDREADFRTRQAQLVRAAAEAPEARRGAAWLDLARFYLARNMAPEAKGVLDLAMGAGRAQREDATTLVMRAVANIMLGRGAAALKDLAHPVVGNQHDAPLWRALAYAQQGKWIEARVGFKTIETALPTLPAELQRLAYKDAMRAAIEVRDFGEAVKLLQELETVGVTRELQPVFSVLKGRIAEGLGRAADADAAYKAAADSWDRSAAAQGRLRSIVLRHALGEIKGEEAITGLEAITTTWRGDETEVEALQLLARLYTEEGRYRDAFHVMRTALAAHPNSEMTRRIHDEAAATFDSLFLAGKGDTMPAIDALTLFYDYKELTPVGRRGDEMIRRLAERLVAVDLLDQAAELLQHQVDHRLQGAARAQVAIRLSVVYLMARKPERTIQVLRETRTGDLPNEVRNQRLLIEGRALADTGRHDVALEVVANVPGREAERLRADILWSARRWRAAAEQIEKFFGERWRDFSPLRPVERADLLRAGIGYALADDRLGMDRFRQKYGPIMAEGPDARAFEVVTVAGPGSADFAEIAKSIAATDTLDNFLRDINARFPDSGPTAGVPAGRPRAAARRRAAPPQRRRAPRAPAG